MAGLRLRAADGSIQPGGPCRRTSPSCKPSVPIRRSPTKWRRLTTRCCASARCTASRWTSVRRAMDDLDVAGKLAKGGVIEREKLLARRSRWPRRSGCWMLAEEGEAVAVAALNLAIGLNASSTTDVVDTTDIPPFTMSLAECLQTAVACRREFQVARKSISAAQEGSRAATRRLRRRKSWPKATSSASINPIPAGMPAWA